jgi:MerR family copper efflux transcriptional regulator
VTTGPDCPIIDEFSNPSDEAPPPAINARFGRNGLTTERGGH